ncbi:MAG: hypothetical protein E6600_17740 [Anaerocolumna aminovalerica]|jgi:methyl-accepting chemotaxis protein|uniref:hypothetical protein n=1 Tax=Anaerocolumna aminovalerica TaxID=1527 RepID=UPI00290DC474|nr:hypothetical protein [Anaerocolumna aminovalerica]MDU6266340.1 hypothetical protein [Anaerocolumna aminovalerica]
MYKMSKASQSQALNTSIRGFKTLLTKILVFIGGPVIISYLAVSVILLSIVSNSIERITINELSGKSQAAANEINGSFEKMYETAKQLSMNSQIEELFRDVRPGMRLNQYENFLPVKHTLEKVQKSSSNSILNIWVTDVDSSQLAQADGFITDIDWDVKNGHGTSNSFTKIERAAAEEANAIEQIKQGLIHISAVVQNNPATAEENSATSEEMSAQAATLHEEVGKFKLDV